MSRLVHLLAIIPMVLALSACGDDSSGDDTPGADASPAPDSATPLDCTGVTPVSGIPTLAGDEIANNLASPVDVKSPPGDARIFVVEQDGTIRIVAGDDNVRPEPFIDLTNVTQQSGEEGLLGLAFHPQYAQNGRFFVYYTNGSGNNVVAEGKVSATDPDKAEVGVTPILTVNHPGATNHNGGWIDFGPDGHLYVGTGDGGGGGDPDENAQNTGELLGKILRLDVSTPGQYAIPSDNPFAGQAGTKEEIWALGVRNPWRNSFDRQTGDLYIADVGQSRIEEVNVQPAASKGGENYGWDVMEGTQCFEPMNGCDMTGLVKPVHEYLQEDPTPNDNNSDVTGSITGGYVYRGCKMPDLAGTYFFADYALGRFYSFKWTGGATVTDVKQYAQFTGKVVTAFGQDKNGEVLYVDYIGGRLYRLVPAP